MISLITRLWNIRHRKLIQETKAIIRLHRFLRYDCGLKCVDEFSAKQLKHAFYLLKIRKKA
jgi:hypothetical protein